MARGIKRLVGNLKLRLDFAQARLSKLNGNLERTMKRFPKGHPDIDHIKANIVKVRDLMLKLEAQIAEDKAEKNNKKAE